MGTRVVWTLWDVVVLLVDNAPGEVVRGSWLLLFVFALLENDILDFVGNC